jgi:hypothetical protein
MPHSPYSMGPVEKYEFRFKKRVNDYALVVRLPKAQYRNQLEGEQIILKKVGGKWVVEDSGSDLPYEWGKKLPELFR